MPRKVEHHTCEGNKIGQATADHHRPLHDNYDRLARCCSKEKAAFLGVNAGATGEFTGSVGGRRWRTVGHHMDPVCGHVVLCDIVALALSTTLVIWKENICILGAV